MQFSDRMNRSKKKLLLKKDTVRSLATDEMLEVGGAGNTGLSCPTVSRIPMTSISNTYSGLCQTDTCITCIGCIRY